MHSKQDNMTTTAIILAGGLGTRIASAEPGIPKVLIKVSTHTILDHLIHFLLKNSISKICIALGHKSTVIKDHVLRNYSDVDFVFSIEEKKLGTGGAVRHALKNLDDDQVLVVNGDTFADFNVQKFKHFHNEVQSNFTVLSVLNSDISRYGALKFSNKNILSFNEKNGRGRGWINAGSYMINVDFFLDLEFPEQFELEELMQNLAQNRKLFGFKEKCDFIDIGIPEDLHIARKHWQWPEIGEK